MSLPQLSEHCIFLVTVGSSAYGISAESGSDVDQTGVLVESPGQVIGLLGEFGSVHQRTKPQGERSGPGDIDRSMHSLRKFWSLALAGNPSILETLWAEPVLSSSWGDELVAMRGNLVTKAVIPRYQGYMQGQAERLLGVKGKKHGKRGGGQRDDQIEKWGWDRKYAAHCVRLGMQCHELLTTGSLSFPMKEDQACWLRDLRNGLITFDDWFTVALYWDEVLSDLRYTADVPDKPNMPAMSEWITNFHLDYWKYLKYNV